jgi:hypothetical protein
VQVALAVPSAKRPWKTGAAYAAPVKATMAAAATHVFKVFICSGSWLGFRYHTSISKYRARSPKARNILQKQGLGNSAPRGTG